MTDASSYTTSIMLLTMWKKNQEKKNGNKQTSSKKTTG